MTENQPLPEDSLRATGFDPAVSANNSELVRGFNYVLAIAIDEYQHIHPLYNCVRDAEEIIGILTTKYAFEAEQVRKLYNADATTENILLALPEYAHPGFWAGFIAAGAEI